ncbi:MAG TPA: VOC family protein [Usitatibacteraceae bacterium]|nr:VOC family protein [Usitatibacteraceae bacterium]
MIDRFDHLFLQPADFERSLAFYRDTLGWAVVGEWAGSGRARCTVLSGGATKVVLAERRPGDPADGRLAAHLDIHDVDRRFARLPPGTEVVIPPGDSGRGTRWFVVRDPDGNLIAFEEQNRDRG